MQHLQKTGGTSFKPKVSSLRAVPNVRTFKHVDVQTFQRVSGLCPVFRTLFQVPYLASPLLATLTKTPGVGGYSSHFGTLPPGLCFRRESPITSHLISFLSLNCRLSTFLSLSIESDGSPMTDLPPSERFKTEMPQIPGVSSPGARTSTASNPAIKLVIGLLAVLLVVFLGARWAFRPKHAEPQLANQPQIEVPSAAPDPSTLLPHATDAEPGVADATEMAKPWSSKEFLIRNRLSGENIPAFLIRLPAGSPSQPGGYWAFEQKAPYGDCKLEYVTDLDKLKKDYGFRDPKHPMVGNPCSRTVFDPLKTTNLPGTGAWARGSIVQGSDLRPPLAVELKVEGKKILAVRTE